MKKELKMKKLIKKINNILYRSLVFIIKLFYRERIFKGSSNIDSAQPCIYVGNHCQMHSPLDFEFSFPHKKKIWCISDVMSYSTAPKYMYKEFWKNKNKYTRWLYKILSYIITPFAVFIFSNSDTIAVYRNNKISKTFKDSVSALERGESVIIFPEHHKKHNNIICDYEQNFVYLAKLYYKKTGKQISFVPFYNSPKLRTIAFGEPIKYNPSIAIEKQKEDICSYLMSQTTQLAHTLPVHTVIPYENVKKSDYPKSLENENY